METEKILNVDSMNFHTGGVVITALLVAGYADDYAVYVGHGTEERVRGNGRKLSYQQALMYFPDLERAQYRH